MVVANRLVAPVTLMTVDIVEAKPDFVVRNCTCTLFKIETQRTNALQLATIYLTDLLSISVIGLACFSFNIR